jgi:predicted esterase
MSEQSAQLEPTPQKNACGGTTPVILRLLASILTCLCVSACKSPVVWLGARGDGGGHSPEFAGAPSTAAGSPAADGGGIVLAPAGNGAGSPGGSAGAGGSGSLGAAGPAGSGAQAGSSGLAAAGSAAAPPQPSSGCGLDPPAADNSIERNGSTVSYIPDLATGYDSNRPYPLIVSFRGAMVTPAAFRRYLDLTSVVGADGIVVTADCVNGASTWDLQRDLPFFDALITKLESQYCIDQGRIYVVGHATGAIFANAVACMRDTVRALGSLSGAAPSGICLGPVAVWISQGSTDSALALGQASRDFWVGRNGCSTITNPVDPEPCVEYAGCAAGAAVRYCEYGGDFGVPSFAAAGVWNFLKGL